MHVVIAGGHGKIALILERLLTERGDSVAGFIRNPDHADELKAVGADPLVVDLERASVADVAAHLHGADAVVFAAGAGPGSGAARKETVDRDAAILLADAAEAAKVRRYVMVSSINADANAPHTKDDVFTAYLRAKGAADDNVRAREGLDSTIVRPGHLTNDPGSGLITAAAHTERGDIPRADVAAVLLAALDAPAAVGRTFNVISGNTPIADVVGS